MALKSPTSNLSDFLKEQKSRYLDAVKDGKGKEWTVVMGNEAGDLDSLSSAIAYSWFAATVEKSATVALFRVLRGDLHLRAENLYALQLAGLDASNPSIMCLDDIPTTQPFPSNTFALVDHNSLHAEFSRDNPEARVVAVIDHHADEGLYKNTADPRIITVPTGSASSLVSLFLREKGLDQIPPELARLLLCSIMIDCGGLKPGGKAEQQDRDAAAFLIPHSLIASSVSTLLAAEVHEDPSVQELTSVLMHKKTHLSHLDTRDLLRRDYKEYNMIPSWAKDQPIQVGLSSIPMALKVMLAKDPKFWSSAQQWMRDRNLSVLGVLTSFRAEKQLNRKGKPKHKREQLFLVRDEERVPELAQKLFAGLVASDELKLKNKKKALPKADDAVASVSVRAWKQGNVDATRKITAPLVKQTVEGN